MKNIKDNKGITNMTLITIVLVIIILMLLVAVVYLVKNPSTTYITQNLPTEQSQLNLTITENKKETVKENVQVSNDTSNTIQNENQYKKIKGTYEYTTENYSGYEGIYIGYRLSLKEDGTFNYEIAIDNAGGFCGNYIINGSEIILNKLFNYGSDVGINLISGQIKLKINQDGAISDSNKYEESPISSVVLTKKTTEVNENLKDRIYAAVKDNAIYVED